MGVSIFFFAIQSLLQQSGAGTGWGQKASAAIGLIKTLDTLRKKPHITLKKPQFH
jgi:hypothetical protein